MAALLAALTDAEPIVRRAAATAVQVAAPFLMGCGPTASAIRRTAARSDPETQVVLAEVLARPPAQRWMGRIRFERFDARPGMTSGPGRWSDLRVVGQFRFRGPR